MTKYLLAAALLLAPNLTEAQNQTTQEDSRDPWVPISIVNNFQVEYHEELTLKRTGRTTGEFTTVLRLVSNPPIRLGRFIALTEQAHVSVSCTRQIYTVEERVTQATDGEIRILRPITRAARFSARSSDWIQQALASMCAARR